MTVIPARPCKRRSLGCILKNALFSGLLVIVPVVLTAWVVSFLFRNLDNLCKPLAHKLFRMDVPGLGILLTLALLLVVGILANNFLARRLIRMGERILARIPLAGGVYDAVKRIMASFTGSSDERPKKVVLVPYPTDDRWAVGFLNGEVVVPDGRRMGLVLVLGALNPTTGFLTVIPVERILLLDIPVDSAMALIISGGMVAPGAFPTRPLMTE